MSGRLQHVLRYYTFLLENNKGANLTEQMHRLICAVVVCMQQSQVFSGQGPYGVGVAFHRVRVKSLQFQTLEFWLLSL